jgi:autophagy-related protein 101
VTKADEETVWEAWAIDVTVTSARGESEVARNRRKMERGLQEAAMKVLAVVNQDRGYIPPITTNDANPFPFQILVNPKNDGWGQKIGIF